MGTIQHNAIIATTGLSEHAEPLQSWINNLPDEERKLFSRYPSWINGYVTFFLAPDGSKEMWETSDQGDKLREKFKARLKEDNYEDESSPWSWVEIGFGECGKKFIDGSEY